MPDVSYVPGPLTAVAGDQCWVLVEASPDSPAVARIWQQFGQRAAADALLAGLLADGADSVPGFALLTAGADGPPRLFCRGAVGATVVTAAAAGAVPPGGARAGEGHAVPDRIDGAGLLTWREHVAANAERIFLGEPPADTAFRLPATSGVLLAGCVVIDFTNFAARETMAYEPQKPVPVPVPVPVAASQVRASDQERAAVPAPVPFTAAPAGPAGTAAAGPAAFAAPAFPAPPPANGPAGGASDFAGGASDFAGGASDFAGGVNGPAGGVNGEAVDGGHLNGDPGGDGEYDFFWGSTQMRSVEDAAIRDPGDSGSLPTGQFAPDVPPVASGPWDGGLPGVPPPAMPLPPVPPAMPPAPAPPSRLWQGPDDPVQPGGMPPGIPVPGAPVPAAPLPGGLIDVPQWLAVPGGSASTVKRGDLPESAAGTPPPDRIGPVVPALICPNGHVNPPSGAACRQCGAPLPHDPVPVPRPVLGVLRLSLGDVITLDRGVVMGRSPRTDFAGADGEERPHVVKLSTNGDVSRTHLRVTLDGWHVLVTDLNSTNGTLVALPGHDPQQLRPGEPMPIQPGTVVTLAEGIDFCYEVTD